MVIKGQDITRRVMLSILRGASSERIVNDMMESYDNGMRATMMMRDNSI